MSRINEQLDTLADAIDALLPQTQCGRCGYSGCRPYAEALAAGAADLNRCPPGGDEGVAELAALLGVAPKALDPACGPPAGAVLAVIDEERCIGCTLCIRACPVDAIVGAPRLMHTVLAEACNGCELCIAPCPVDCISLRPTPTAAAPGRAAAREANRSRYAARNRRLARERELRAARLATQRAAGAERRKRDTIARALERARLRLQNRPS